jgi:hypothetical protein
VGAADRIRSGAERRVMTTVVTIAAAAQIRHVGCALEDGKHIQRLSAWATQRSRTPPSVR